METHSFLIQLVIILFSARLAGEVASYFKVPSVIGELVAGILIGPSLFGFVEISQSIYLLGQIGIILLLFEVGVETDLGKLKAAGKKALVVALSGVLLPFALGFYLSYVTFHFSILASLFIGSTLTATSIGITLRVFQDLKKQKASETQIIVGAAVLDDIIGIVILSVLFEFSTQGGVDLWNIAKVLLFIALFFLLSPLFAKGLSFLIEKWNEKSTIPGLLPTLIISLILFFAWLAHSLGAPELLGGFAAGLALSKSFNFSFLQALKKSPAFTEKVEKQMKPIIHLFTPVFFVVIGLSLDLKSVNWLSPTIWGLTGSLLLVAVLGKFLSGFCLKKEKFLSKCIIGTAMTPRGEVGLIFANVGLTAGVLTNDIYTSVILVITLTTLLAPFALRVLYKKA